MSDSLGHGRFDIPDYDQLDDESFPPLPPPLSPGLGGDNPFADGEEDGDLSKLADAPPAKRKTIRRPQPKLDSQRLISERGLPALRTLFNNVRFKGKGHEAEDLRVVMQKMENWAHRLYPKLQFDDFMEKVERLGSKKDVQTCLKKIRLDMPLIHEDFIGRDEESEPTPGQQVFEDPDPFGSTGGFPGGSQGPVHSTPAPFHSTPAPTSSPSLTEEQRRRIELNKQLALERRLSRKQPPTELPGSQGGSCGAASSQADSSQAISPEAGCTQASFQADSSQAISSEAVSAQAPSSQADLGQAVSPEAGCTQAVSSEAVSTQASPVHLPPDSLPPSKPCPPEPRLEDMEVEPSQEAPDYSTAKDSPASLASPQREEGEPSQPGS